jgi:hypothetical protein
MAALSLPTHGDWMDVTIGVGIGLTEVFRITGLLNLPDLTLSQWDSKRLNEG